MIGELRAIVGDGNVLEAEEIAKRSAGAFRSDGLQAGLLVRPADTREVSEVLALCHARGARVVTQGGLTGLVHGADAGPTDVILSLERMRAIEQIDPTQRIAVAQAGVVLQALQEAADKHDLLFPLDLGGRGSATLGGNAATNAGGNRVIRYGMMRDMVLGLEAVLADGTIVSSMNRLIKNNAGYDLKQIFIGSEGTLGVITRLVLRLREKPRGRAMALVGVDDFSRVVALLRHMDRSLPGALSAFEVMWNSFYRLVTTPPAKGKPPIGQDHPYYVLIETHGGDPATDSERFAAALNAAMEAGLIADAALSQSEADCLAFWSLRDNVEMVMLGGYPIIFDVSLPLERMEAYARALPKSLDEAIGPHELWIFGHLGDGNLHVIVQVPFQEAAAFRPRVERVVYEPLGEFQGSVSAEHGIGLEKKPYLHLSRTPEEIALMRALKTALDPKGVLNPGKIF
jgi:FAD/FMN-containing dehydrogenase